MAGVDFDPAAWRAFSDAIGSQWVMSEGQDRHAYSDHFAADESRHEPAGAVSPASAEEVQAIVKLANRFGVSLWPISRGKNFGYGGSAPVMKGSVVLDLTRMKKIDVDEENGTVLVDAVLTEPDAAPQAAGTVETVTIE